MTRLSIDPLAPDPDAVEAAARAIKRGGIVAMPTDTLYGLAGNPFSVPALPTNTQVDIFGIAYGPGTQSRMSIGRSVIVAATCSARPDGC